MKKFIPTLLLAAGVALAGAAHAEALVLKPIVKPLDPALERTVSDAPSGFETRALSIPDASALLASPEGAVWRAIAVQAPACESTHTNKKAERKKCQAMKVECAKAAAFARSEAVHATCSALYTQTKVLLTNDAPPGKRKAHVATPHKLRTSAAHKPSHKKVAPVSGKPAAGSCDK